jgi:hypothetical protein
MIRKLALLGLSLLAVVALGALAVPAAQAEATFTVPGASDKTQTTLTMLKDGSGSTAHWVLDIPELGSMTCNEATATAFGDDGAMTGSKATHITIATPTFAGCTVAGLAVNAQNKGCGFTFKAAGGLDIVDSGIHKCEHTKEALVFSGPGCTVEIGKQSLAGVTYHTVQDGLSGKKVVTAEANGIANITYEAYGFVCPLGTKSNATLTTATAIITGEDGFGTANLEWDAS